MIRWLTILVAWVMISTGDRLQAIEVCLVNDTDQEALFTVISGIERLEKRVPPKSRAFIDLVDAKDDRVVIAQRVQAGPSLDGAPMTVVGTQVLKGPMVNLMNFCYVHGAAGEEVQVDLLGFRCLDIVPLDWKAVTSREDFGRLRSALIASLRTTEEVQPESQGILKQSLGYIPGY